MSEWLTEKFLDWQRETGKRQTVTAFAKHLGVSRDVLNQWMNGRRNPSDESADLLAKKLGEDVYDVLGIPRPDPRLQAIVQSWGRLSESKKAELYDEAQRLAAMGTEDDPVAEAKRRSEN